MFRVFECEKCKAQIISFDDEKVDCCGEEMIELIPNSVDAAFEKHVPVYEIVDGKVKAKVNHVMDEDHYIEWIAYLAHDRHDVRYFEPSMVAESEFDYVEGAKIYAYCNKHGLWMCEVK